MEIPPATVADRDDSPARPDSGRLLIAIGAATAAAHIGNNFTTFLIGGLMDRFGFTPLQMGAWSTVETLSYAGAMFLIAPRVASLSPRLLLLAAGVLVVAAQSASAVSATLPPLLAARVACGLGFGLANTALNLAAGQTAYPARAISVGIACQTMLYALINLVLPMVGERYGVAGMFAGLALLSAVFTAAAVWLPNAPPRAARPLVPAPHAPIGPDGWRVLAAVACFTFGSLAIWQFIQPAARVIGVSAVAYGRDQSAATLASALGNLALAGVAARLRRSLPLTLALLACGLSAAALTTVSNHAAFAAALVLFNTSWFITYPLLLGIAYAVDPTGRLAVLSSAAWLLMESAGSLVTGLVAQVLGSYTPVGPLGMAICISAIVVIRPLARRLDVARAPGRVADALPSAISS